MKKKKASKIIPRRGPPTNLRKAGAHEDKRRKALKARDEEQAEDLIAWERGLLETIRVTLGVGVGTAYKAHFNDHG